MILRPYQDEAKNAVYQHLRSRDDNPCVVIPTGGGKTPILASICKDAVMRWRGRLLILAHVKELLVQASEKLQAICPELEFGVYSAGLRRRETDSDVIVAGIQSTFKRACEFDPFDLIIIDEAHMIPAEGDGMYRRFLADAKVVNPQLRVIGMTATPFRLKSGPICTPDHFLNHVCFEVGIPELIRDGYLSPLVTKAGLAKVDTSSLRVQGGEFVASDTEKLMDDDGLVESACNEIVNCTADRRAVLIFASGVKHGRHIVRVLREEHDAECGFIYAKTPPDERQSLITRFKSGELKYLCNVNVLTMGFDAEIVDCVALLRPTASTGLYYQMVGRGFRLHPDKKNCLVLDFGGNVLRHGPVDQMRIEQMDLGDGEAPAKECPQCNALIATGYSACPHCNFEFPPRNRRRHEAKATEEGILSQQIVDTDFEVLDVTYTVHTKRDAPEDAPKTMRVDYRLGLNHWQSEFICLEHGGYARQKAVGWWRQRSPDPVPDTAERGVEIAEAGGIALTDKITVRSIAGEKYDRIVHYTLGPMPEPVLACDAGAMSEVPF